MKMNQVLLVVAVFSFAALVWSCGTVPITGRQQFNIVSDQTILSTANQEYRQFLNESTLSRDATATRLVRKVGANIQQAVTRYFTDQQQAATLNGYEWEFNLVEDTEANAWCMPGGKVVVFTGMLPITQDENGLAVIIGHEIAHAVAKHGNERMSEALMIQLGGMALDQALRQKPQETRDMYNQAYGIGSEIGLMLPFSRVQETEADELGLIFMAMAGYDPQLSVAFWERMTRQQQGFAPPQFLSGHPSDQTRIENLRQFMPQAMAYYKPAR